MPKMLALKNASRAFNIHRVDLVTVDFILRKIVHIEKLFIKTIFTFHECIYTYKFIEALRTQEKESVSTYA